MDEYLCRARQHDSLPAVKSFWYGKFLQTAISLNIKEDHPLYDSIHTARYELLNMEECQTTFLSPHVHHLITQSVPTSRDSARGFIDNHFTVKWSLLESHLTPFLGE